jgi:hypothetical protein
MIVGRYQLDIMVKVLKKSNVGILKSETPTSKSISVVKMPTHCSCLIKTYKAPSIYTTPKCIGFYNYIPYYSSLLFIRRPSVGHAHKFE